MFKCRFGRCKKLIEVDIINFNFFYEVCYKVNNIYIFKSKCIIIIKARTISVYDHPLLRPLGFPYIVIPYFSILLSYILILLPSYALLIPRFILLYRRVNPLDWQNS